jgi:hypothetical protein
MAIELTFLKVKILTTLIDELLQTNSIKTILLLGFVIVILAIANRNRKNQIKNDIPQQSTSQEGAISQINQSGAIQPIEKLLTLCKVLIQEGNTKESLQNLLSNLEIRTKSDNKFQRYYEEVLMLSNRLRRLEYNQRNCLGQSEELSIQNNSINKAILDILDELSKTERQHG